MTVTKEQIRKLCYQDKIYFGNTLMNRDEDTIYCSHTNVIELYSKIKQYGRENGLFLNNNPYDTFSYADIAVGSALGYVKLRYPEIDFKEEYLNLHRLYELLMQRPSFQMTVPEPYL